MITSTGKAAERVINRSSSSSELGSAQCASSNSISTGHWRARFVENSVQRLEGLLLLPCGLSASRRIPISTWHSEHLGDQRHLLRGWR